MGEAGNGGVRQGSVADEGRESRSWPAVRRSRSSTVHWRKDVGSGSGGVRASGVVMEPSLPVGTWLQSRAVAPLPDACLGARIERRSHTA